MFPSVSFIVPALNEEKNIESTVNSIIAAVNASPVAVYEIILVNDGSSDQTRKVMEEISSKNSLVRVFNNQINIGVGASYLKGVKNSIHEYVMIVAGDNVASVSSISNTIFKLGDSDILLPYIINSEIRPLYRRIGSRAFTELINFLFGLKIKYYQGAVFRRDLLDKITVYSTGYAFFVEIVIKLIKKGATYKQVGIAHTLAAHNNSSAMKIRNLVRVLREIFALYKNNY